MIRLRIITVITAIIFSVTAAQAQEFYGGVSGRTSIGEGGLGTGLSGHIGAAFNSFRGEGEIAWHKNEGLFGDTQRTIAFLANGYYDFDTGGAWKPYIGAGIGYALLKTEVGIFFGTPVSDDSDNVFAYQAMAGVGYEVSPSTTIYGGYKYFATADASFTDQLGNSFSDSVSNHNLEVGVRFGF